MSAQAAAALQSDEPLVETLPMTAEAVEEQKPAEVKDLVVKRLESMLEKGDVEGVKTMVRSLTEKANEGVGTLGEFPEDTRVALMEAAPAEMKALSEARTLAQTKIEEAEQALMKDLGTDHAALSFANVPGANDAETPAVVEAVPEVVPVEVIQPTPMIRVGEAPNVDTAPNADPELIHEAEELKAHEQEQIVAELDALNDFSKHHPLAFDTADPNDIKLARNEEAKDEEAKDNPAGLNKVERLYAVMLVAGHKAANTSLRHAETLLAAYALPENDPQRVELMAKAETLLEQAQIDEVAAQFLKGQYMKQPEIAALLGPTGGSMGGGFDGGEPPGETEPPKLVLVDSPFIKGPNNPSVDGNRAVGFGGVSGSGLTTAENNYKPGSFEPVKRTPGRLGQAVRSAFSALTFGWYKPGGSSRE